MSHENRTFTRPQKTVIVYGMTCFILVLVICQIWLVTATVNAFLGGDDSIVWPVAIASFICLGLNMGLLRYLYLIENPSRTSRHRKAHDS
jgi:hypothetical protein